MKLSNSNKIAIIFSSYTFIVSLFFVLIFSYFSFKSWYEEEKKELNEVIIGYNLYEKLFSEILKSDSSDNKKIRDIITQKDLDQHFHNVFLSLYYEDDRFYIIDKLDKENYIMYDVSIFMKNQIIQLRLGLFLILLFTLFAFFLSKFIFAKLILKEFYALSHRLSVLDINNEEFIKNDFYDKDIREIVEKINLLLGKIYEHQKDLKYFNSQVSHEFKTPLMVINSELEFLEMEGVYSDSIRKIQLQVDKLNNLLNSFILLTRIDNTKLELTDVLVSDLLEDILSDLKKIYKNKNIKLNLDLKNCKIKTNKGLLYILLKNLLDNAFKYTNNRGFINISFDCKSLVIKNSTNNEEINLDKVFKMFYRNSSNLKGFGIGLAVVKRIVDSLGYKLDIKHENGNFIVRILFNKN